ncbi:CCR4-NOT TRANSCRIPTION COMPLEX RELATED [Salix koriyanagi]|uniref:CCR4-NOT TRANSCRIPTION COMPLEX RELATED n=2 Tax=Salix koriyanagi TaxID=2511006 RepID=A0A9Q0X449_9ROSI|nr:CCR4-NOT TRANSCRIPTION COMPLEX RELATED [Salix koriyanagi]
MKLNSDFSDPDSALDVQMAIMSDKGDKTCPLCAEEMDLTDQQLKPCQCGYEICVWCWNHIMEMADKDNSEGRCPACRIPYDKEKIVGMAANCERLVAEMNSERKLKSHKGKPKSSEGRMHLSNVRVIQRNLVYIIGLPLNIADETLLQRRDYFGQYGKVLKVSISRTATGAIQHSANNSCCVYITYAKEEEAACCIQSVHSFVLEGRSLRACFGTTKYCHAWLKNMPCSIPDCLYLHDFGSEEDSFTKDDLVSAFTRSRVQQIIGATNNLHRRSGNVLPPPADECTNRNISLTAKNDSKSSNQNIMNWDSSSYAESGAGISNTLHGAASWVTCVAGSLPPVKSLSSSGGTPNHIPETSHCPCALASEVVNTKNSGDIKRTILEGSCEVNPANLTLIDHLPCSPASQDSAGDTALPSAGTSPSKLTKSSCITSLDEDENFHSDGDLQGLCSGLSSISTDGNLKDEYCEPVVSELSISIHKLPKSQVSQPFVSEPLSESSILPTRSAFVEDLPCFDDQEVQGFEIIHNQPPASSFPSPKQHLEESWQQGQIHQCTADVHPSFLPSKLDEVAFPFRSGNTVLSNGLLDRQANDLTEWDRSINHSSVFLEVGSGKCLEEHGNLASGDCKLDQDTDESSIISNILSMDSGVWEDSLTSPQSLVKFLADNDTQQSSLKMPCIRKPQESSQSRFSFARQDDFSNHLSNFEYSLENATNKSPASNHIVENKEPWMDNYRSISSNITSVESNGFLSRHPFTSSSFSGNWNVSYLVNRLHLCLVSVLVGQKVRDGVDIVTVVTVLSHIFVSKTSTSPPPGFSVPSRAVPPGFLTHGAVHYDFDHSANHFLQNSAPLSRNSGISGDVEFIDPAIMEVGKGFLSARLNNPVFDAKPVLSPQFNPFDHDSEFQMLMRQSISAPQNPRLSDHFGNRFSPLDDAYTISPMLLGQSPPNKQSPFTHLTAQQHRNMHMSNGSVGGWNEADEHNRVIDLVASKVPVDEYTSVYLVAYWWLATLIRTEMALG